MATFFLIVIYLAFISLGLPDSLLGSAWPVMRHELNAGLDSAGLVSMVISIGTILSSLFSHKVIRRYGTGKITFVSVLATAIALLGFSMTPSFIWLILFAIPLGLGAGSVDAALNNYVALHYKPQHMSWLHCFWGIGATLGPIIMAQYIQGGSNWRGGYLTISIIQFALVAVLLFALPLWEKASEVSTQDNSEAASAVTTSVFKIKGLNWALASFLFYCAAETTTGLWGSSFLVHTKNLTPADAARWISMFYAGITVGRLITGFITMRISSKALIRGGQLITLLGAVLLLLPYKAEFSLAGLIFIGLGCAPIFPCMLHETPHRFGKEHSQRIIGLQMAFAYTGSTFLPPILGLIASRTSMTVFPIFLLVYIVGMLLSSERINRLLLQ